MLPCDIHQVIWQMMKHYPYCGRIGIKQYNPTKPTEYGLLWVMLVSQTMLGQMKLLNFM